MQQAESNLDLFWNKFDQEYRKRCSKALNQAHTSLANVFHPLEQTPESIDPIRPPRSKPIPKPTQRTSDLTNIIFRSSEAKFVAPQPKVKPKTRGCTSQGTTSNDEEPAAQDNTDEQPIFQLTSRALKVLNHSSSTLRNRICRGKYHGLTSSMQCL
jgi:hypothetical protein